MPSDMNVQDYMRLVADRIDGAKEDKEEIIRLMKLLRDTLDDIIEKHK